MDISKTNTIREAQSNGRLMFLTKKEITTPKKRWFKVENLPEDFFQEKTGQSQMHHWKS